METAFTPLASFAGGMAIGLSTVLLMLGLGRILGFTGIMAGLVFAERKDEALWRAAMMLGMLLAPGLIFAVSGSMPRIDVPVSPVMIVIGGVLVGVGARRGSGCTTGHGVCGLARVSVRSMVAVPTFMATAGMTVFLLRHVFGG